MFLKAKSHFVSSWCLWDVQMWAFTWVVWPLVLVSQKRKRLIPLGDGLLEISLCTLLRRTAAPQTSQMLVVYPFLFPCGTLRAIDCLYWSPTEMQESAGRGLWLGLHNVRYCKDTQPCLCCRLLLWEGPWQPHSLSVSFPCRDLSWSANHMCFLFLPCPALSVRGKDVWKTEEVLSVP